MVHADGRQPAACAVPRWLVRSNHAAHGHIFFCITADRETVEERAGLILKGAKDTDVAFLVVGSPFAATTHIDLMTRAEKLGIECEVGKRGEPTLSSR